MQAEQRDLSGCVAVVTGASDGIGYETAKALADMGADTILACRNQEKTTQVIIGLLTHSAGLLRPE